MTYVILRILWNIWLVVAALMFLVALSRVLFQKEKDVKGFLRLLAFIPVWPIFIFSEVGRQEFKKLLGDKK